ncbi:Ig-like domain-containing protein, partial [Deinococcus misasensis]|uniref:Ig-like domain-containing protein n=1 Tax=Deinococcus misasensis TaxID=392413 RepID=UPI000550043D
LTEGDYTLVVTARDNAGNSQSVTVTFKVQFADVSAPVIVLDAPVKDSTVTVVSTEIKGKVTDNRGVQSATISVNGGEAQTLTLGADGSFSFNQTGLDDGTYNISITAKDTSNNTKTLSSSFKVVLPDLFEPNNTFDKATPVTVGSTTRKAIIDGSDFDVDWYKFEAQAGDEIKIEVLTQSAYADSALDSIVYLYPTILNEATLPLAINDDADPFKGQDMGSALTYFFFKNTTYYIKVVSFKTDAGVADNNPKNTYQLKLSLLNKGE